MELCLSCNAVKTLSRSITCLARIGNEVVILANPSQIVFRTLNTSRSSYLSMVFKADFFDKYSVSGAQAKCSVLLKDLCSIFRTPPSSMDRLSMVLPDPDAGKLQWTIECVNGMKKTYWINCNVDPDIQYLVLDRRKFPSHLVVKPREFNRLLSNFQSSLQEITLIATSPSLVPPEDADVIGGKAVELQSYIDPTKGDSDTTLHTQLWIDPAEEFLQYCHKGDPVDVTFSMKESKAFISFCEGCELDLQLYFEKAGEPILMAPKFGLEDSSKADFDATLVLATMLISQLEKENEPRRNSGRAAAGADGDSIRRENNAHTSLSQQRSRNAVPTHSYQSAEHTRIWSELSGSAAKVEEKHISQGGPTMTCPQVVEQSHHMHKGAECSRPSFNTEDPVLRQPPPVPNNLQAAKDGLTAATGGSLSQRHPSNWIEPDEDEDDDEDGELIVQSTPHYDD